MSVPGRGLCTVILFLFASAAAAQSADLFVSKSAPGSATVGANVKFTILVGNAGPDDASGAGFNDPLPAGATFVSFMPTSGPAFLCSLPTVGDPGGIVNCSIATLGAGVTATFDIFVNVSASAAGTTLINSVSVFSNTLDENDENNTSITGTDVAGANQADVGIVKFGPGAATADSDVSYTITVTNAGPNDAASVSWSDTLPGSMTFVSFAQDNGPPFNCGVPAATTTCSIAVLPLNASAAFTFVGHIPSGTPSGTTFTNRATVSSSDDPNSENNAALTALVVSEADVAVIKTAPQNAVAGGPTFDYKITLSNSGPDTAIDASFTDALPAGLTFVGVAQDTGPLAACGGGQTFTCTIPALGNGASAKFTLTVQPSAAIVDGTSLDNTATASTASVDSNQTNDSSTASTAFSTEADVSIVKNAPIAGVPGTNMTYTITVANAGPSDAAGVSWTDTLPANTTFVSVSQTTGPLFTCSPGGTVSCSIVAFAAGASATFNVVVQISAAVPVGSTITNTATVGTATPDTDSNNNASTDTTLVSATAADVSVTKSGPATAPPGSNVAYTVTVANAGPSDAVSVTLTENVPVGLTFVSVSQTSGPAFVCSGTGPIVCTIATFANGASAVFQFTFGVPSTVPIGTQTSNTVTIASSTPDPDPSNDIASVPIQIAQLIPTLSWLAMALLALSLAALGSIAVKRSKVARRP